MKYLKYSPRGFANEVTYFAVPEDKVLEADKFFAGFEDTADGGYVQWTKDNQAHRPGAPVDWADRNRILPARFW